MAGHDIVVIGTSSGGVEALTRMAGGLPFDLPAAVFVVMHFPENVPSVLPLILSRAGPLEAAHPEDGDPIEPGRIYVAPPDLHLLLERDRVRIRRGPREKRHRPAVDALFRTAGRRLRPAGGWRCVDRGPQRWDRRVTGHKVARWCGGRTGSRRRALPWDAGERPGVR